MLRKQTALHIAGAIMVCAMGTLAHFVYEWSGNNPVVGLFCAVNESTWEHIKLLFFPMLLYTGWRAVRTHGREPAATAAFLAGNLAGCVCIQVVFYTYTGILGFHLLALDIGTFVVSVAVAFIVARRAMRWAGLARWRGALIGATALWAAAFFAFTFMPPNIGLFVSP